MESEDKIVDKDPEVYIVEGYAFYSPQEAEKAEKELKKIRLLDEKLDADNLPAIRALYIKALDQEVFETQIGLTYLRNLQMHLIGEGYMGRDEKPIPIKYSKTQWEKELTRVFEEQDVIEKKVKEKADEKVSKAREKTTDARAKIKTLYMTIAVLVVLIIAMFVISFTGKSPNVLNYRNAVINEYSEWEQELQEREEKIREKEAELNNE